MRLESPEQDRSGHRPAVAADRLLVFARRPVAGRVKTRLTPPLAPDDAAQLYEACLHDVVATAARERARIEIWYDGGAEAEAYFAREFPLLARAPQAPGSLGERLEDALARSFADGAERVAVVGSDAPTLPLSSIAAAFDDLHEVDAVLGPAADGGYYLVGVRAAGWPRAAALFRSIPWSTDEVLRASGERAAEAGLEIRLLPGWYDLDRAEDLVRAREDADPESHLGRWLAGPDGARYLAGG
ncbi:MAG TPA: TIGR04282 family arsenosugar biosynthesis glycosyltransferase [Longimicrobiales bacterium]|nr:TIGR04282 family arsenosugar biosynthesis glycosyltransferase [Longimicrobiales bacterium]